MSTPACTSIVTQTGDANLTYFLSPEAEMEKSLSFFLCFALSLEMHPFKIRDTNILFSSRGGEKAFLLETLPREKLSDFPPPPAPAPPPPPCKKAVDLSRRVLRDPYNLSPWDTRKQEEGSDT